MNGNYCLGFRYPKLKYLSPYTSVVNEWLISQNYAYLAKKPCAFNPEYYGPQLMPGGRSS